MWILNYTEHSWHFGHSITADEYSIKYQQKFNCNNTCTAAQLFSLDDKKRQICESVYITLAMVSVHVRAPKNDSLIFHTHCSILLVCCSQDMHMDCIRVRFKQLCTSFNGGSLYCTLCDLSSLCSSAIATMRDWETVVALSAIHLNNAAATKIIKNQQQLFDTFFPYTLWRWTKLQCATYRFSVMRKSHRN